jgi:diaminohydroxyphosphoribosylaminopyrimidine deaminase/5-amino-6-(5-phosphoribosylamino)uracil reductase
MALAQAGEAARGATAYVTLEPCAHHGVTPPCAEALIAAGIVRAVIACSDPDPRTAGKGIMALAAAGIETVTRVGESDAMALNAGFFQRLAQQRPWVTLKLATSLDGCIATASGESKWITGEAARLHGHALRARHDAILTGIGTVLADDPRLDCRLPGLQEYSPVRVVMDRHLRLPLTSQLVRAAAQKPLWVFTQNNQAHAEALQQAGVEIFALPDLTPLAVLQVLAERGITRLMVEAGPHITSAFLEAGLVNELQWYRAPAVIGQGGVSAFATGNDSLAEMHRWVRMAQQVIGHDSLEIYRPA